MTPLILFALAWAGGIWVAQAIDFPPIWLGLALPPALVLLIGWGDRRVARHGATVLLGAALGAARLVAAQPQITPDHVASFVDNNGVAIEGVVIAEPDWRPNDTRLRIDADTVTLAGEAPQRVKGRLLAYAPPYAEIHYGDRVVAVGDLQLPVDFADFSYRDYLARQGIHAILRQANVEVTGSHQANPVLDALLRFKARAYEVLRSLLPEPEGSLLAGILLGIERDISPDVTAAFAASGTTHIIAISGFNLTFAAGLVARRTRRFLHKRGDMVLALAVVWAYVLLVGASAAVLRAGVMASLLFVAERVERKSHGPTSLAAAVLLLSLLNPFVLWDIGFQLSVAAMAGLLIYVAPFSAWLTRRLARLTAPERAERIVAALSDVLIVTLAVQLTTLPVQVGHFHTISPVAPLANLLMLPAQPFVMGFGALALACGFIWHGLGTLVAYLAWVFLAYTIAIPRLLSGAPVIAADFGTANLLIVDGYYGVLAAATWVLSHSAEERRAFVDRLKSTKSWLVATGAAAVILVGVWIMAVPDGKLHVTFLEVDQGDAVFIETPSGRQILVDGGSDPRQAVAQIGRLMPFWDRQIDLVVLTSPDDARLGGLVSILERYQVDAVGIGAEAGAGPIYDRWVALLSGRAPATVRTLAAGDLWDAGDGVVVDTLWPSSGEVAPLVLRVTYGEASVLLMGDTTTVAEEALVARYGGGLRSQVLQLGRYGNKTSTGAALLQAVAPDAAVVGCGPNPDLDLVKARLMTVPLYETQSNGTVQVTSDGISVKIRTDW